MNIFGIGGPELLVILIIMLIFAGPKRMIHWAYILGQYLAKFRVIWSQTVDLVQKEFDEAGVDIKLPKEPPTRQNINRAISDALQPMTQPLQESLDEVKKDMESVKAVSDDLKEKTSLPSDSKPEAVKPTEPETTNNASPSLGTWSSPTTDK